MSEKRDNLRAVFIGGALALLTFIAFWHVLGCDFILFDDDLYVTENSHVKTGLTWAGLKWAFTSMNASNWHPLTWISHMLDCQFFGLNAGAHHLTNLLFHVADTVLLFVWLKRLTGAVWKSAIVAALFAWHPLHVESVAWVAERKDVLSTFFWMLTLLAYADYAEKSKVQGPKSKVFYLVALLCFLLGLLSKPMLVTLPFVLLLMDWWMAESAQATRPAKLPWKRWLLEKIPFFALAIASCVVTFLAQKSSGSVESLQTRSVEERAANAAVSYVRYLEKTFWPAELAVFYPHSSSWPGWMVGASVVILLAITLLAWRFRHRRPWLMAGWLWFLGTLVPVIGIVQVGRQSMADRYTYVPMIGVLIIIVWGFGEWVERGKHQRFAAVTATAALAACMVLTWRQVGYWKNTETLFTHDIELVGYNYFACYDMGKYYLSKQAPEKAIACAEKGLEVSPVDEENLKSLSAVAHFKLGIGLKEHGDIEQAIQHLSTAVELVPTNAELHLGLGEALAKQGKANEAIAEFTTAAQADSANPEIQTELAAFLSHQNQTSEALGHYREAVRLYRAALEKNPDSPTLMNNFAWLLATNPHDEIRNGHEAVELARKACESTHWQRAIFVGTLAAAYAEAGQFDEAAKTARKAHDIALTAGERGIAARNEELLKLYETHQPYREK